MGEKTVMIEGMTEETARKYLKSRDKIDSMLIQIAGLGWAIRYSSNTNAEDIEVENFGVLGDLVAEKADDILEELDELISSVSVEFGIMKIDRPEEYKKLNLKEKNFFKGGM